MVIIMRHVLALPFNIHSRFCSLKRNTMETTSTKLRKPNCSHNDGHGGWRGRQTTNSTIKKWNDGRVWYFNSWDILDFQFQGKTRSKRGNFANMGSFYGKVTHQSKPKCWYWGKLNPLSRWIFVKQIVMSPITRNLVTTSSKFDNASYEKVFVVQNES